MKKSPEKKPKKLETSSVIVLAAAAVVFLTAFFLIYGARIFGGEGVFTPGGNKNVEFEKASVIEVLSEDIKTDEVADGAYTGSQELYVIIQTGRYRGEEMVVNNYFGPPSGVPVKAGDSVTVTIKTRDDGDHSATVYEFNRIPLLAFFILLFFAVALLVGRFTGFKSLLGLLFTIICLFIILIPLLLNGAPTIITTFVTCAYIALVCFTVLGGVHRKTVSAFLGTAAGMLLAMLFGIMAQSLAKINGLRLEDAEPLLQLKYEGGAIRVKGLLVAGIIISALGAVMDVAMSISSSLEEVHAANPQLTRKQLFASGMNIGRDMAGTMTNTLILALLGSEFTLIIFLYSRGLTFYHLFSTSFVALETISGISSSIGLMLAIPLTALISSALLSRGKPAGKKR